jgi:hypothetical protein
MFGFCWGNNRIYTISVCARGMGEAFSEVGAQNLSKKKKKTLRFDIPKNQLSSDDHDVNQPVVESIRNAPAALWGLFRSEYLWARANIDKLVFC